MLLPVSVGWFMESDDDDEPDCWWLDTEEFG